MALRHKCFLSYHHDDFDAVKRFAVAFEGSFIHRGIAMPDDVIDSDDTDYVMQRIRELFLEDSTVTIVLIGQCTWARRFVDWEIQASLRRRQAGPPPNGLVAVQLSEYHSRLPERAKLNVDSGYAKFYKYPSSTSILNTIVQEAFHARDDKSHLIENPRDRYRYNRQCP